MDLFFNIKAESLFIPNKAFKLEEREKFLSLLRGSSIEIIRES